MNAVSRPCGTCKAPIYDLVHARTGKLAPIDAEPDPAGNIMIDLDAGSYVIVGKTTTGAARHVNHWATCPDADRWRQRRAAGRNIP